MPAAANNQPAQVIALHEQVQPSEYILEANICTIGRSPMCQIVVQRGVVSRLHARIEREGPRYVLIDAGSANGTFVNGRKILVPHLLKDRDLIGLGAVEALLRFIDPDPTVESAGRLRYDEQTMTFFLDQQALDLTPTQLRLLLHLHRHTGTICTRESCAQAIWGQEYDPGRDAGMLDRAISSLRQSLRRIDSSSELISTQRGIGYILNQ